MTTMMRASTTSAASTSAAARAGAVRAAPAMRAAAPAPRAGLFSRATSGSKPKAAKAAAKATKKVLVPKKGTVRPAQQFKVNLTGVQSKKASGFDVTLGFTKANELFVGRLAMLGFSFACLGEIITGKGAIAQLGFETGISPVDADGLILGLIGFNLIAAFFPASGKFVVEQEEEAAASSKEKVGFFKDGDDKLFKGGFGFTKDNELFVGRMAQLGFAASLIGELYTGDPFSPFFWHLWLWAGSRPGARGGGTSGPRGGTGGGGPRRLPRREFAAHCDRWALPRVSLSGGPEHRMVPEEPFIQWNRPFNGTRSLEPGILLSQDSLQQCCNRLCLWPPRPPILTLAARG